MLSHARHSDSEYELACRDAASAAAAPAEQRAWAKVIVQFDMLNNSRKLFMTGDDAKSIELAALYSLKIARAEAVSEAARRGRMSWVDAAEAIEAIRNERQDQAQPLKGAA